MTGKKGGFMDDLISREKAIEAMEGVDWYHINKDGQLTHGANSKEDEPLCKAEDVYKVLNDMPSAQPEIVRCKDCKNRGDDDCPMRFIEWVEYDDDGYIEHDDIIHDYTKDDGFCDRAERRTDEQDSE